MSMTPVGAIQIRNTGAVTAACSALLWAYLSCGAVFADTGDETWKEIQEMMGRGHASYSTRHRLLHGEMRRIVSWDYAPSNHQITLSIGAHGQPSEDVVQFALDEHILIWAESPGDSPLDKQVLRLECDPTTPCITESYYLGKVIEKTALSRIYLSGVSADHLEKALRRMQVLAISGDAPPL